MKKAILFATVFITMIFIGCGEDPLSPKQPETEIRLKTGNGLRYGASVHYVALSKNVDFSTLPGNIFEYDKTKADWYIDGGSVPFITDYKRFAKPVGKYYFLVKASGVAMMSQMTVKEGEQTWLIHAEHGSLDMDTEQP